MAQEFLKKYEEFLKCLKILDNSCVTDKHLACSVCITLCFYFGAKILNEETEEGIETINKLLGPEEGGYLNVWWLPKCLQ